MTVSSTGSSPPVDFSGLGTGLNTQAIINAYLSLDEGPLADLETQQNSLKTQVASYQTLQSQLQGLQSAADAIAAPGAFASDVAATSSNSIIATASTGVGATTGSTTFSVAQLASADTLISSGTVAAASDVVASGSLLVASGGAGIGIASVAGTGLSGGSHTIAVTQASAGASVTGSSALGSNTTINATNDTVDVTLNGTGEIYTLASGSYNAAQLASALVSASGGALDASLNGAGAVVVSSANEGSSATLSVGNGSANDALGLSFGQSGTGTDGVITVDGTANTISAIAASGTTAVTLSSGSGGTVNAELNAGGVSLGTLNAENVSVGNGSLASVVSAINGANAGVNAEAIAVGPNAYALEIAATQTGAANAVSIDPSTFGASSLGSLTTTTTGQNAIIDLGGPGGYAVQSASNTVSGLLAGVSINLLQASSTPVTISVNPDGTSAANAVSTFVNAANTVLQTIASDVAYNPTTNTAGPLNGDYGIESLAQQILSQVGTAIGSSTSVDSATPGSAAGLSLASSGTINFDPQTFAADFNANPAAVGALFGAGGTFNATAPASPGDVSLEFASDLSEPGVYALNVSQSGEQATDLGTATFASPATAVGSSTTYTVQSGSLTANYAVGAGETLAEVAAGLNTAFAQQGLQLSATTVSSGGNSALEIVSNDYGSNQSFTVGSSASDVLGIASASAFDGVDVAGTINGVSGTGDGQILSAPSSDPVLAGLAVTITTPGITSPTAIGTYSYAPGIAQSLATVAAQSISPSTGIIPTTITSLQNTLSGVGSEITSEQQLVSEQQAALIQEYDNLDTTMSSLQSESSFLTNALGGSSTNLLSALSNSQQS